MIRKLFHNYSNLKYRYKLMILIVVTSLIPTAIVGFYMQAGMMRVLKAREIENMEESLHQAVNTIENQMQIYENLIDYLSYSSDLREVLEIQDETDFQTYLRYTEVADPLLQMPRVYHKEISGITLYAENIKVNHGDTLAPLSEMETDSGVKGGQQEEGQQNEEQQNGGQQIVYWLMKNGAKKEVAVMREFYGSESVTAILKMTLDYNKLLEPFGNVLGVNFGGAIWDEDGNLIYSRSNLEEKYQQKDGNELENIQKYYSYSLREMDGTRWNFCLYCPTSVITESAYHLMLQNIPILAVCILLLLALSYLFAKQLVLKLEQLTDNMNQIHRGIREVTVHSESDDEVGVLIRAFRRMMDEINKLISEVYESKIALQKSELRALQAQINPHFLYNSLSIINWKAIEADELEISKVTLDLSTYYRTSLNRGEMMTTVESEIYNIRAYLRIQLVMHDNSFRAEEEVDETMFRYEIPKLILQPLVENAIEHGLDTSDRTEKLLRVTAKQDEEFLIFSVYDNGNGMTKEKAEEIISYQSRGYGVRNVNERIILLYGEEYRIHIQSSEGEGTCAVIRIPKKAGEKHEKVV